MSRPREQHVCVHRCRGLAYLWLLFAVAALGLGLTAAAQVWTTMAQREREAELLFVGDQFRRAIGAYYEATPGASRYPRKLEDLLSDARYPAVRRHLRRIYRDPMSGTLDWGIVSAPDGGIAGVFSKSGQRSLKKHGFKQEYAVFEGAALHSDWKFIYVAGSPGAGGGVKLQPTQPVQAGPPAQAGAWPGPGMTAPAVTSPAPAVVVPAAPAPPTPPPDPKLEKERTEQQCKALARDDATTCEALRQARGEDVGARCKIAATARLAVCLQAGPFGLPELIVR